MVHFKNQVHIQFLFHNVKVINKNNNNFLCIVHIDFTFHYYEMKANGNQAIIMLVSNFIIFFTYMCLCPEEKSRFTWVGSLTLQMSTCDMFNIHHILVPAKSGFVISVFIRTVTVFRNSFSFLLNSSFTSSSKLLLFYSSFFFCFICVKSCCSFLFNRSVRF